MKKYILELINKQQNYNNNFINVSDEDLNYLTKKAHTYDMNESEIIEMILDLKYA